MSRGTIYFLGENPDFRVITDQIFARNDISGATIIVPYRIEFSSFRTNGKSPASRAEVLFAKGELRTKDSSIKCSENIAFINHRLSKSQLSFESEFQFTIVHETMNKIENQRKGDLLFSLSVVLHAAVYEEIVFTNNQSKSFISDFDKGSGHIDFQIQQSYWVNKVLPQTGYDSFRLIELPSTSLIIPLEYKKSLNELDEAKKYFLNGDYDKAVGHCRSALDPFKPKKDEIKTFIKSKSESVWVND